ncbi:tyrosine-sulfated glycopeptide receptor 1-like [Telopea speciosissima]|uniref:tyrosine-sulfated glycopeptide receptor 1-like n=1 Tax=Telopea speciosissima TaxID=54955 RepID=UPI001CC4C2ED|nr:tyrosine-sulfated glycopeptide receptor 1-like [Telopea speciosissima]
MLVLLQSSRHKKSLLNLATTLFVPFFFLCLFSLPTLYHACNHRDRVSLLYFSQNLSTPLNWSTSSSSSSDCCIWDGVHCDGNGWVTNLSLSSRGLRGSLSPSLANLTRLSYLNLSHNFFSGSVSPSFLSSFDQLQTLDLSFNHLTGNLPTSASPDRPLSLQTIDISSNLFNGDFQLSFLGLVPNLSTLDISNNTFTGLIPSSICLSYNMVKLLDFSFNEFSDQIPSGLGSCLHLEVFKAGWNQLSGTLPSDIYNILSLRQLSLPCNNISGNIDGADQIVRLANLVVLDLSFNEITGQLPQDIGNLRNLEQLILYKNNISGPLPSSMTNCINLRVLNLRDNHFEGELTAIDFSKLVQLNTLDLGGNKFSGNLPMSLYSCTSLTAIRLTTNQLEGQILPEILALQSLSYLAISTNQLTNISGAFQILMHGRNLTTLLLSKNFYGEPIPDAIDSNGFQNLRVLAIGGCNLTGQVPTWFSNLKKLAVLDLSQNQLTGSIPGWLGTLPKFFYIDLSSNLFTGELPLEFITLPSLASSGPLEQVYLELPLLVQTQNSTGQFYNQISSLPPAIYLSDNNINGSIPPEIGKLQHLHVLDLSLNNFSGEIPDQLSNLTNLERLDLSRNNLSDEIPSSLTQLHFLSWFSVAYNNLEGPIPTGGQFDTFSNSSFIGNPGLCGAILQRTCHLQNEENPTSPATSKSTNLKHLLVLVLGICFGCGCVFTVLTLWCMSRRIKPRREDSNKIDPNRSSCSSNLGLTPHMVEDSSLVMLFPGNSNECKDLQISDILKATNNFDQANIIGCGGFGLVYKATLPNGTKLAVKKLSGDLGMMEREFKAEVEALSAAQHENLVSLRGYCVHDGFRMLIYSYMENGSVDYWLHEKTDGSSNLDWPTRLKILQGACRGLCYMHQICEPHIVHRDIKSSNILLDEHFEAHVADFGLSRLILPYKTHVSTELVGTLGYIPPEYGQAWVATLRGDVYSFGVVMLELLTGKRPVDVFKPKMSRELVGWVKQTRSQGRQDELFDPLLRGKGYEEEMVKVLQVACLCVNQNPFKRPTIKEVEGLLENVGAAPENPR